LFGRAARQGDPGSAQAFVSVEDELVRRFLPRAAGEALRRALGSSTPGTGRLARTGFRLAQSKAQKLAYKARQSVLRGDNWLDESLAFAGLDAAPG
jgi:preprotein translocase subunit SecA